MKYVIFLVLLVLLFAFVPLSVLAKLANPWIMVLVILVLVVGLYVTYTIGEGGNNRPPLEE